MMGLFYSTQRKNMMAEGLYRQVLDKLEHDKQTMQPSYNLVMALNFYARMLMQTNEKRVPEAKEYLAQAEKLSEIMPHWYDKIDNVFLGEFDLDWDSL